MKTLQGELGTRGAIRRALDGGPLRVAQITARIHCAPTTTRAELTLMAREGVVKVFNTKRNGAKTWGLCVYPD